LVLLNGEDKMSKEGEKEKIKKIAKLRPLLEKRIKTMEAELDGLKTLLELLDATLLKEGFKRAEVSELPTPREATPQPSVVKQKKVFQ
jgi:hypothetical protein